MSDGGISVQFSRYYDQTSPSGGGVAVVFKIPDDALILDTNPETFMTWCYNEMMILASKQKWGR